MRPTRYAPGLAYSAQQLEPLTDKPGNAEGTSNRRGWDQDRLSSVGRFFSLSLKRLGVSA